MASFIIGQNVDRRACGFRHNAPNEKTRTNNCPSILTKDAEMHDITCGGDTSKQLEMRLIKMSGSATSDDLGSDGDVVSLGRSLSSSAFCGFCGFGVFDVTCGESSGGNGGGKGGGPCPALLLLLFSSLSGLFAYLHI